MLLNEMSEMAKNDHNFSFIPFIDGHGPSKVTRAILVSVLIVGGVCAIAWCIFVISTSHSDGAHKSDRELNPLRQAERGLTVQWMLKLKV